MWKRYLNQHPVPPGFNQFPGVTLDDIISLEKCFDVKIKIYSLNENGSVSNIHETMSDYTNQIYLNIYHSNLSYITNFKYFAESLIVLNVLKCSIGNEP